MSCVAVLNMAFIVLALNDGGKPGLLCSTVWFSMDDADDESEEDEEAVADVDAVAAMPAEEEDVIVDGAGAD